MSDKPRSHRHYKTSPLPTLAGQMQTSPQQELLLSLYGEICSSWRMLTDVRFKLLGFVPVVSGLILLNLLTNNPQGPSALARSLISVFGLLITLALLVYEKRNTGLYNELISRGRKIEEELGIDTGHFRGRPEATSRFIRHDAAINLIYGASLAGWLTAVLFIISGL